MKLSDNVKLIRDRLLQYGFEFYIVGGAVRDYLLGKKVNDIDVATNACPDDIKRIFSDQRLHFIGKSFLVSLVNGIEVATYRTDKYFGLSDKNAEISYASSIYDDLLRRDLTINAMAIDHQGTIIDPFNGLIDLNNKTIKFVGNPNNTIWQDPNRILRAIRFRCATGFEYDYETWVTLKRNRWMFIKHVHPDRINVELMKVMKLKDPRQFFYDCHNARLLRHIFAPLEWCWKQPGGPYHNEDVFTHCVDTCFNYPQRYPKMRWAALVHDVGKKDAARILDDGEWHFYNHELKTDSVKQWMKYLRFSEHTIKQTIGLIESHMLFDTRLTKRQARRALAILKEHDVPYCCWIHLGLADKKANRKTSRNEPIGIPTTIKILTVVESVLEEEGKFANNERNLAINGKYIMELLNIKPGPILGVVKRNLCNAIYDGECFNTFESLDGYIKRSMIEYERDYSNILLRIIPYWIVHRHFVET